MEIMYQTRSCNGSIQWAASEDFRELLGRVIPLSVTKATDIAGRLDISITSKILLSAVAGAVIQHLIDKGISYQEIAETGKITIPYC